MKPKDYAPLRRRTIVLAVGAALATLAATPALADPLLTIKLFRDSDVMFRDADMSRWSDNYVELGVGYNSADSLRFGQFSGLTDQGAFPLAGFNWLSRNQANDAQYWQVHGANLGLDSRKLKAEGGIQGKWTASFSFDGLNKSQTESASFVHQGLGSSNLTLRTPWAMSSATPANLGVHRGDLRPYDIDHGRDIYRLGLKGLLGDEWDYKVSYREDRRDGTRMTGMYFSAGGGAIVPYEIDDKTQQIEAILSYTSKIAQFQLGYTYSRFENALNAFNVQNPFYTAANNLDARMSLAPDNDYHQINATGAYNFSKTTRLSATYSYGKARQNQDFLPYSVNGTGGANTTAVLPRSSLDAEVVNTLFDVALTSKPIDKMNLKVAYQYRDSDNRTPINQYRYVGRDGAGAPPANPAVLPISNAIRTNAPMSSTENKFSLEGDYEIAPKTILRAGLERSDKEYTLADRKDTQTDKLTIELRRPFSDEFLGSVGYIRTERTGSDYDKNVYFRNSYTGQLAAAPFTTFAAANGLTNNPSMRMFMWADFDEDRLRASGNWTVNETLSLQGVVDGYQQKMRGPNCNQFSDSFQGSAVGITPGPLADTCLGRDKAEGGSVSLDLQYQPEENLTTFAFANFAQTEIKQIGREWTKGNNTGSLDSRNFHEDMTATDYTFGLGLKWQPEEKWNLGSTYVYSYGIGETDVKKGSGIPPAAQALPNTWNKLHSLQLFAKWDYSQQLSWRFNYLYENLKSYDWAISNVPATGNGTMLFTGQDAPRYSNHVFGVSAVMKSW